MVESKCLSKPRMRRAGLGPGPGVGTCLMHSGARDLSGAQCGGRSKTCGEAVEEVRK